MNILSSTKGGLFPGDVLFELKATHGFPLDFALDLILVGERLVISWVPFIEAARKNGWWDFQTYQVLCHAMEQAQLPLEMQAGIKARFQIYVLENPLTRTD